HFDPEERTLVVTPGKLVVSEPSDDELNRGRLRVNVAFTLPPGAYATLVVKRLFWWTLEPKAKEKPPPPKPRPTQEQVHEDRRRTGFLAKKRARKAARAEAPAAAKRGTASSAAGRPTPRPARRRGPGSAGGR
ncbi:MAG: tRNA pseudouridine(13) synthase TruD, partial [Anaeromyxobacteraceae bacterium]